NQFNHILTSRRYVNSHPTFINSIQAPPISQISTTANDNTLGSPNYNCKYENCYRLSVNTSGSRRNSIAFSGVSVSNVLCIDRKNIVPTAIDNLWATSTASKPENFQVPFVFNTSVWGVPVDKFVLYKVENAQTSKVAENTVVTQRIVEDPVAATSVTEYKMGYVDKCNSESALSPSVFSLFLDNKRPSTLFWPNKVLGSKLSVQSYEVVPLDETSLFPITPVISNIPNTVFTQNVDVKGYQEFAPFFIKAKVTGPSSITEIRSNITKISIPPNLYFPNSFSPNADGLNDYFQVFGPLSRLSKFSFSVHDRMGTTVYEIPNLEYASENGLVEVDQIKMWDGLFKGKPAPSGVYSWKSISQFKTGESLKKQGSITLLR
ncbi:MAG: gliding motility-associated C-terminal domain-containing protein, partial [Leadbetterella sp.]